MSSRWTGFFVWALVAACAAFWGLKIFAATHPVPPGALAPVPPVATAGPMVRLFGALPVQAQDDEDTQGQASDRFQLVGVIAPRSGSHGIAIVSVDNQPAKAWHIGATVEGDTTLLAVAKRSAEFGPEGGPTAFTLELPAPEAAATGTLPDAMSQSSPAPMQAQPGRPVPGKFGQPLQGRANAGFLGNRPGMPVNRPGMGVQPGAMQQANTISHVPPPLAGQAPPAANAGAESDDDNSDE